MLDRLSNSAIGHWQCKFYYYLLNVARMTSIPGPAGHTGRLVHKVAESYMHHLKDKKLTGDWDTFLKLFAHHSPEYPAEAVADAEADVISSFQFMEFNPEHIYGIEMKLALDWDGKPIPYELKQGFRGILDLVQVIGSKVYITDWKSGYVMPTKKAAEKDQQLWRYAWLVYQLFGEAVEEFELTLEFLRLGTSIDVSIPVAQMLETTPGNVLRIRDEVNAALASLGPMPETLSEGDWEQVAHFFPATPCSNCTFCGLSGFHCPLIGTPQEPDRPTNMEEAQELLGTWQVFTAEASTIMTYLNWFVSEHGPVEIPGSEASFKQSFKKGYDEDEVVKACRKLNLPPDIYMVPNTTAKLRDMVFKTPELKAMLGEPRQIPGNQNFNIRNN